MKAAVLFYNFKTGEMRHQVFDGRDCYDSALKLNRPESFIHQDFPKNKGWTTSIVRDEEVLDEKFYSDQTMEFFGQLQE